MANTLRFKRGLVSTIPTAALGEPLFTTDTFDLYIGNGTGNTRFQKYIASGTTSQLLRGDGSLLTMPIVLTSPANGEVLKYNGTNWVNSSDAGVTGSGASGQVTYWNGTSTVTGSNNLFWDATNNRLGVKTNTPTYSLSVAGGISLGNDAGISILLEAGRAIRSSGGIFLDYGNAGSGDLTIRTGAGPTATAQFYFNGNINLGVNGQSVGIGQPSPVTRLDVAGAMAVGGALGAHQTDRGILEYNTNKVALRAYGTTSGTGFIAFNTGGGGGSTDTERMRIFAGGNVAIGSTSDNGLRFQVTGDGYFSGSVGIGSASLTGYNLRITKTITGSANAVALYIDGAIQNDVTSQARGIQISPTIASGTALTDLIYYFARQNTFTGTATNQFGFYADNNLIGATNNFGFYGNIASGTGRWNLYMNGSAANYLAGTLSIGTTANDTGYLRNYATIPVLALQNPTTGTATSDGFQLSVSGSLAYIWQYENSAMLFGTNATERMRLDASGNLGLGVVPSAWNSKSRSFELSQTNRAGWVLEHFRSSDATAGNAANIGVGFYRGTADDTLRYINSFTKPQIFGCFDGAFSWYQAPAGTAGNTITLTQAMTLDASGHLALGSTSADPFSRGYTRMFGISTATASGSTAIELNGGSGGYGQIDFGAGGVRTAGISGSANETQWGSLTAIPAIIFTNSSERIRVFSDGNVGIGTGSTNAGFKLDVNGTMRVSGVGSFASTTSTGRIEFGTSAFKGIMNYDAVTTGLWSFNNQTAGASTLDYFQFQADGAAILTLKKSGAATFSSSVTAGGTITIARGQDANVTNVNINSGVTPVSAFQINTDQPNLRSILMARNGYSLVLGTQDANRVTIDSTGAATFSSTLTLSSTASSFIVLDNTTATTGRQWRLSSASNGRFFLTNVTDAIDVLTVLNTGAATFSSTVSATSYRSAGVELMTSDGTSNYIKTGATLFFQSGATTLMSLTTGGNLAVDTNTLFVDATNDRVGIGTTTPTTKLDVVGAATFSSTAQAAGFITSGGTGYAVINSAATTVTALRPTGGGTSVMSTNSNGLHIAVGTQAAGDLILASNNTERIRLSQNGFFSQLNATNPSASITDSYIQYSADVVAGNAAPHFRTENGAVIKLYQETTGVGNAIFSQGGGNSVLDDSTFDGYTLRQIVKALRNQGILA